MKKINKKYLRKTYTISEETIIINLEDIRDNYIEPNALGKIGTITLLKGYIYQLMQISIP